MEEKSSKKQKKKKKKKKLVAMAAASLTLTILILVITTVSGHRYKDGDPVVVYVNKIGPFSNPIESYRYFDLPFCASELASEVKETLGQVLDGGRLVAGPFKLKFRVDLKSKILCKKRLKRDELSKFRNAIEKDYYFEMYLDGLPIWGFIGYKYRIGSSSSSKFILFNNLNFVISYDGDYRVCFVNLTSSGFVDISDDKEMEVEFLYSVKWEKTSIPFERRMDVYISWPDTQSHWFSTLSSSYLVILLAGFVAAILIWLLKNDLAKYAINDDFITDQDETGWKNIHGDVFRYPEHKFLLAASIGSGIRLLFVFISMLIIGFLRVFPLFNQGNFATSLIIIYALASFLAGYTSTSFYCQLEGTNWVKNLIITEFLFSGPLFLMFCFLNTIASINNANAAMSLGTIFVLLLIWILLGFPLLVFGGIAGKIRKIEFEAPCKTTKCPREIPPLPWHKGSIPKMFISGVLPFSMIYIQLHYIFSSLWGYGVYPMYGALSIAFALLLIVTALVTVTLTYFQLSSEHHQWWWRSFFYGGSTGLFTYSYCFYYYAQSHMSSVMQISFFFGYMACLCYGVFLSLGTIGFFTSMLFVRHIYGSIKCE